VVAARFGNKVSIAAASMTEVGASSERGSLALAEEALSAVLEKSGTDRSEIDGFVWNLGTSVGENYDVICSKLGIRPRFVVQTWTHGRFTGTCVQLAAMAVASGAAANVVCLGGVKTRPFRGPDDERRRGIGMDLYARPAARVLARYLQAYGAERDRLLDVVMSAHRYASLNPQAFLRDGMAPGDYQASPFLEYPLKVADCLPTDETVCPINDFGACVLVTSAHSAALTRPVYVLTAQSIQAGSQEVYFGRPGLGEVPGNFLPTEQDLAVFSATGLSQRDVDGFYTYDAFSPLVWYALERFGYCAPGEAHLWATAERLWLDGDLPTNTNGGIIAAGHTSGWGQIVEMVEQLRGDAGARQIPGAEVLHWGTVFGDSLLLTNTAASSSQA
jgi:acetyl-CoA acetyltransferase